MTSLAAIDGDLISYIASAACEKRTIKATSKKTGRSKEFPTRTEFKAFLKETNFEYSDFDIEDIQTPQPIENCLHTVKSMINGIHSKANCKERKIVVSGEDNFRDRILLPKKYKWNRAELIKPVLLPNVKEYILTKYNTEISEGREADDVLTSLQYEGFKTRKKIVACSIDKDSYQTPGLLFNWNKMTKPVLIKNTIGKLIIDDSNTVRGWGRKWLYFQATVGDTADGYKPTELCSSRYGEKAAYKDFVDLETDKECLEKVVSLYQQWYPDIVTYAAWDGTKVNATWKHLMQMYFDCAFMQRWDGDRFDVDKVLKKYEIDV